VLVGVSRKKKIRERENAANVEALFKLEGPAKTDRVQPVHKMHKERRGGDERVKNPRGKDEMKKRILSKKKKRERKIELGTRIGRISAFCNHV